MDLQELIFRGRFLFSNSPKRLEAFKLVNGRKNSKDIAISCGRGHSSVLNDLKMMSDYELIQPKMNNREIVKKDGCIVYEKVPLLNHISTKYFENDTKSRRKTFKKTKVNKDQKSQTMTSLHIPTETEILDICRHGEDQIYEFKEPGVATEKITKEIAAFLHTKRGGLLFYGVDDDGGIIGSDKTRQEFDQSLQNSIRYTISPQPNIDIVEKDVLGQKVIIIRMPPWDTKTHYQYTKHERYYIRRGTNVFAIKPEEFSKLGKGEFVV